MEALHQKCEAKINDLNKQQQDDKIKFEAERNEWK